MLPSKSSLGMTFVSRFIFYITKQTMCSVGNSSVVLFHSASKPNLAQTFIDLYNDGAHGSKSEIDDKFISERTTDFNDLKSHLEDFSPEKMSSICGIDASIIHEVARIYASSPASIIFWGMGVSQHVHGTDNARALISLALMTGQVGRPLQGQVHKAKNIGDSKFKAILFEEK